MSTQRAIFSVTCDSNGQGYDDVTLKLPTELTRHAQLVLVTVDVSAAFGSAPSVTLSQLTDVTAIAVPVTAEATELGNQLFHASLKQASSILSTPDGMVYEFDPRFPSATESGDAPSLATLGGLQTIRSKQVRCEVFGGVSADVVTVNMYYETAGDYRF